MLKTPDFVHSKNLFNPSVKIPRGIDVCASNSYASTLIREGSRGIELYLSKPGAPKKITKGGVVERKTREPIQELGGGVKSQCI